MDIEEQLVELSKSNMELSLMLLGNRNDTRNTPYQITHLFGRPLAEIYDILLEYDQKVKDTSGPSAMVKENENE